MIYNLILVAEQYAERLNHLPELGRIRLRRVEHIYYKVCCVHLAC